MNSMVKNLLDYRPVDTETRIQPSTKALAHTDPLRLYISEIKKIKMMTPEEQKQLAIRIKNNDDKDAAKMLVISNLRLVLKIALEFQRVWMQNLLDLIQEGNIGLIKAAAKFDPYRGVKFSYYASFWIKAYILKFIMDNWRLVKIGTTQNQRKLFFKLNKEKQNLMKDGFDPGPRLLSEKLGLPDRDVREMEQRLSSWDVSLDAPLKEDSNTNMGAMLPSKNESPEEQMATKEIISMLHEKMDQFRTTITHRERYILDQRICAENPLTLQEVGDRYGISRERVRQVEKGVIFKIKTYLENAIPDLHNLNHQDFHFL